MEKARTDGYWSYNHMVLQFEDCTDVFKVLFHEFDVVYKLDHSSGHDKEKADGLTTTPSMLEVGNMEAVDEDVNIYTSTAGTCSVYVVYSN
jgi:hypothetical protein